MYLLPLCTLAALLTPAHCICTLQCLLLTGDPSCAPWQCVLLRWGGILSVLDLERACETALSTQVEAFWLSASSSNADSGSSGSGRNESGDASTSYGSGAGAKHGMGSRSQSSAALAQHGDAEGKPSWPARNDACFFKRQPRSNGCRCLICAGTGHCL